VPSHSEGELHVIFGTGQLGMTITRELLSRGKRVRAVNRSGRAEVPGGVEVAKGDAANLAAPAGYPRVRRWSTTLPSRPIPSGPRCFRRS
jgi:hypothetical protein